MRVGKVAGALLLCDPGFIMLSRRLVLLCISKPNNEKNYLNIELKRIKPITYTDKNHTRKKRIYVNK
jgi:hypothetical protein